MGPPRSKLRGIPPEEIQEAIRKIIFCFSAFFALKKVLTQVV